MIHLTRAGTPVLGKLLIIALAACAVIAIPSAAFAGASPASVSAKSAGTQAQNSDPSYFLLKNLETGRCAGLTSSSGTYVLDEPCTAIPRHEWSLTNKVVTGSHIWWHFKNRAAGECMGLSFGSAIMAGCGTSRQTQQWRFLATPGINNYHMVKSGGTGECLGLRSNTPFAQLIVAPCNSGHRAQFWTRIGV